MAVILSFGNQKGGVGKSTITALAANSLSQDYGYKTLVLDVDLQYSIAGIQSQILQHSPNAVFSYDYEKSTYNDLAKVLEKNDEKYNIILVDIPGTLKLEIKEVDHVLNFLYLCDIVIVPVCPKLLDIRSSIIFIQKLAAIKDKKLKKKLFFDYKIMINRADNTGLSKTIRETLSQANISLLNSQLSDLNEYSEKIYSNKSILKHSLKSPKIRREFGDFIEEIENLIQSVS